MKDEDIRRHTFSIMQRCLQSKHQGNRQKAASFPKKSDLGIAKNYSGITLTAITAKFYDALLFNWIKPEIEKILWKNQNSFCRNCYSYNDTFKKYESNDSLTWMAKPTSSTSESLEFYKDIYLCHFLIILYLDFVLRWIY